MKTIYELWDDETGNLLDVYDTAQAALAEVRATIQSEGRDAVATWALLVTIRMAIPIIQTS